ncbi:uncharacterized protein KY384_008412 [Bacidia gigantensis]|uniref:uncharacterized protein n=1 Tax=Bacidia gigantensis TaxID=2732470 RepID=UPI001D057951|nr:uncharacterized protein KY384_008412 [Bacidia gigantensis]KAG8526983.1 hypothetical protein KY384_008412 [Bacidia gigantensis]
MTSFFSLPLELRLEIYSLLVQDEPVEQYGEDKFMSVEMTTHPILYVNHRVQEESASAIFGRGSWVQDCPSRTLAAFERMTFVIKHVKKLAIKLQMHHILGAPLNDQGFFDSDGYHWEGPMQNRQIFEDNLTRLLDFLKEAQGLQSLEVLWGECYVFRDRGLAELRTDGASTQKEHHGQAGTLTTDGLKDILARLTKLDPSCNLSLGKCWVQVIDAPEYAIQSLEDFSLRQYRRAVSGTVKQIIEQRKTAM